MAECVTGDVSVLIMNREESAHVIEMLLFELDSINQELSDDHNWSSKQIIIGLLDAMGVE
jgi:hypothetical protein